MASAKKPPDEIKKKQQVRINRERARCKHIVRWRFRKFCPGEQVAKVKPWIAGKTKRLRAPRRRDRAFYPVKPAHENSGEISRCSRPGKQSGQSLGRDVDETGPPLHPSRDQSLSNWGLYDGCINGKQAPDCGLRPGRRVVSQQCARRGGAVHCVFDVADSIRTVRQPVHVLPRELVQVAPGLELEYRNNVRRIDQRLVLGPFVQIEGAFVRLLSERIDPFLYWWINAKVNEASRGLGVEAAAQRVQKTI